MTEQVEVEAVRSQPGRAPAKRALARPHEQPSHPLLRIGSVVAFIGVWHLLAVTGWVGGRALVSPATVAVELVRLAGEGYVGTSLFGHFQASLLRALAGFLIAVVAAVPVGLAMGMNPRVRAVLDPIFMALRPVPPIAYIPLVILWLGIGEASKILLIFIAAFLYIVLNTVAGVAAVPHVLLQVGSNFGCSRSQLFRWIVLPAALPQIFTGLRTGLALSWALVVAAELIAAQSGLGYMIMDAATFFRIPTVYVGVILIAMIGVILSTGLNALDRKFIHWSGR